ncbi:hypothetical protein AALP_AA8G297600 [Arabis alpina]|uniref:Uncharacterized protein n=1 Tax=Arabis alpina TaxID=50452 RepID=A0A087GAB7_ARAAL|nr:hypothetical protein AALP_AA8G297600 [Arabis alpina]
MADLTHGRPPSFFAVEAIAPMGSSQVKSIIKLSGVEYQRLRINLWNVQEKNLQLAQTNYLLSVEPSESRHDAKETNGKHREIGVTGLPPTGCLPAARTLFGFHEKGCLSRLNTYAQFFSFGGVNGVIDVLH